MLTLDSQLFKYMNGSGDSPGGMGEDLIHPLPKNVEVYNPTQLSTCTRSYIHYTLKESV